MASTSTQLVEYPDEQLIQERDEKTKNLIRGRCVGRGTSGIVYEVSEQWLGKRWVIKDFFAVNSAGFKEKLSPLVFLQHENIVQYYWFPSDTRSCSIVLEYVDDDLRNVVHKKREAQWKKSLLASGTSSSNSRLVDMEEFLKPRSVTSPDGVEGRSSETLVIDSTPFELLDAIEIMFQIATSMEYLHGKGVPHGDLTPNNVCVSFTPDQRMQVKLTDYGLLGIKKRMQMASKHTRQSEVLLWKAPELFEEFLGTSTEDSDDPWTDSDTESDEEMRHAPNASDIDIFKEKKADVYSFATLCSLILAGEVSYPNLRSSDLRKQISCNNLRPKLPPTCPDLELLKTLVEECWDWDFRARPDFFEICERLRSIRTAQQMTTRGKVRGPVSRKLLLAKLPIMMGCSSNFIFVSMKFWWNVTMIGQSIGCHMPFPSKCSMTAYAYS
jgi:serine/threonine protein kinase